MLLIVLCGALHQLVTYILGLAPSVPGLSFQKVRKENPFQYHEQDDQLNQNNPPQGTPPCHFTEPVPVKPPNAEQTIFVAHLDKICRFVLPLQQLDKGNAFIGKFKTFDDIFLSRIYTFCGLFSKQLPLSCQNKIRIHE